MCIPPVVEFGGEIFRPFSINGEWRMSYSWEGTLFNWKDVLHFTCSF
jgi:hypothetical protein